MTNHENPQPSTDLLKKKPHALLIDKDPYIMSLREKETVKSQIKKVASQLYEYVVACEQGGEITPAESALVIKSEWLIQVYEGIVYEILRPLLGNPQRLGVRAIPSISGISDQVYTVSTNLSERYFEETQPRRLALEKRQNTNSIMRAVLNRLDPIPKPPLLIKHALRPIIEEDAEHSRITFTYEDLSDATIELVLAERGYWLK